MRSKYPCKPTKYPCTLTQRDGKLEINFSLFVESTHKLTQGAGVRKLATVLQEDCKLKPQDDYEIKSLEGLADGNNSLIVINRSANIIAVLYYLLFNPATKDHFFDFIPPIMFSIYSKTPLKDFHETWKLNYIIEVISSIGNKNLSISDFAKVLPYQVAEINAAYNLLKQEPLVQALKEKVVESNVTNLLCHPFYQTLSLLMDDYTERENKFKSKSVLSKLSSKKINEASYNEVFKKYSIFVPACYCLPENSIEKKLNQLKLKQSRGIISSEKLLTNLPTKTTNNHNPSEISHNSSKEDKTMKSSSISSNAKNQDQDIKTKGLTQINKFDILMQEITTLKTKPLKQSALIKFISTPNLTVKDFSILYTQVKDIEGLNTPDYPAFDCILGKNTASWQITLGVLRAKALSTLFKEVETKNSDKEKLDLLDKAKILPLFREHRSNSIFFGAWGRTNSVKQIEEFKALVPCESYSMKGC
ncbi:MAG: hypothetical protein H0U70_02385 [Tatlockia sp.]|nr:hypothetical protein [Tatlockia sp.]